jgi:hypothetical protein
MELYDEFHVTSLPLMDDEVRGPKLLAEFSELLVSPK